jgi:hypothetical protein
MAKLVVDLTAGFNNDTVTIRANGVTVAELEGVSTDYSIGLARRVETEAPAGELRLEVTLAKKVITGSLRASPAGDTYADVSLDGKDLRFRISHVSPRYF